MSDSEGCHKRKRSLTQSSISDHRHSKRHRHSSASLHRRHCSRKPRSRDRKRPRSHLSRTHTVSRHTSRSESISSDNDNISVRVDQNEFEGESMTGSPLNNRSKSPRKLSLDKRGSNSDKGEEPTIALADAISEIMSLLPPEICPKKECSGVIQKPRTLLML